MVEKKDYYVADVPGDVVEKLELLKNAGFSNRECFSWALRKWLEKGLEECAKELMVERMKVLAPKKAE